MIEPSSFRDPSGQVFAEGSVLYRRVNIGYRSQYDQLIASGLYSKLVAKGLLVPHEEVEPGSTAEGSRPDSTLYKILKPRLVPFISYPHEWCFGQLKDAALATLRIQRIAMAHGMSLKDCSAYNIQFLEGRPVLIDTLSFEVPPEGRPWVAYRQFCQHFLAPLYLMKYTDVSLNSLFRIHMDGVPLALASRLLPRRTRFKPSALTHIHLHALSQKRYSGRRDVKLRAAFSAQAFKGLVESLYATVKGLSLAKEKTEWADYYQDTNYSAQAFQCKRDIVQRYLEAARPERVWDIGGNDGLFSRLAAERGALTLSFDIDPTAVENNYGRMKKEKETHLLPLLMDFTNPSSPMGWEGRERKALFERGPADTVLALAVVHHFAISNNVPLRRIASFFAMICRRWLIIEFVPKDDSQVSRLLVSREDIFGDYSRESFEREFSPFFSIERSDEVSGSKRTMYLLKRKA